MTKWIAEESVGKITKKKNQNLLRDMKDRTIWRTAYVLKSHEHINGRCIYCEIRLTLNSFAEEFLKEEFKNIFQENKVCTAAKTE